MNLEYRGQNRRWYTEEAHDYFRKLFRALGALTRFSDSSNTRGALRSTIVYSFACRLPVFATSEC